MDVNLSSTNNTGSNLIDALKAGHQLTHSGSWKVFQNWMNLIVPVASIAATFVPGLANIVTPDVVAGVASVLGAANAYITTASSLKIGL
jgi:hypothetical protein